jgi:hypothetical protein
MSSFNCSHHPDSNPLAPSLPVPTATRLLQLTSLPNCGICLSCGDCVAGDAGRVIPGRACWRFGRFNPDQTRRCRVERSYLDDRRVAPVFSYAGMLSDVAVAIEQDRFAMRARSGLYSAWISGSGMTKAWSKFLSRTSLVYVDS